MIQTSTQQLQIKGINEGLLVSAELGSFAELLDALERFLPEKQAFIKGSRIAIDVGHLGLSRSELVQIKTAFKGYELELWSVLSKSSGTRAAARSLELGTRLAGSQTDLDGNLLPAHHEQTAVYQNESEKNLVIKETLRSGQMIQAEGSIIIIGDVNPGAQLIAGGDVIVWGRLRGLVHAGAMGDQSAIICALVLNPTQLRIAEQIAIAPDEKQTAVMPEQAAIRNGQIVAEKWQIGRS